MHESPDTDSNQNIYQHATDYFPGFTGDAGKAFEEGGLVFFPFIGLGRRSSLNLTYPVAEVRRQSHPSQCEAADNAQQDAAQHVDKGDFQAEGAEEHGYGHFIHQRGGNQKGESDSQRDASFHKTDEQRDGGTRAEGGDGSEKGGQQILQAIHFVGNQIVAQPFNREIRIDDAHQDADEEQQYQNFQGIVEEEVYGGTQWGIGTQSEQPVNQPVSKFLYHSVYK